MLPSGGNLGRINETLYLVDSNLINTILSTRFSAGHFIKPFYQLFCTDVKQSVTLREEQRFRVFENWVMRIFRPVRGKE
jgi:hypothetical protein